MFFIRTLAFWGLFFTLQQAQARKPVELNQRHINEYAAMLDHVVYKIIAEPGTRLKDEPLPSYLARLVVPQAKETPEHYRGRVQGYLALLSQLGRAISPLHKAPQLQDTSTVNRQRWQDIMMNSTIVTMKGDKLQALWQACLKSGNSPQIQSQNRQSVSKEMLTTLYYILRIRKEIGIARP